MSEVLSDDWCAHHFDHLAPELNDHFNETLERMRARCPVAHSDQWPSCSLRVRGIAS
jgi:hypothetical protein